MKIVQERFRRTFPEREKIVIPEDEPDETVSVAEKPISSDTLEQSTVESTAATEVIEAPAEDEATPPAAVEIPQTRSDEATGSPASDSNTNEQSGRKKRRRKRRRKKTRTKPPEGSENQHSPPNSPAPGANADTEQSPSKENPPSNPDNDDFGTNVF